MTLLQVEALGHHVRCRCLHPKHLQPLSPQEKERSKQLERAWPQHGNPSSQGRQPSSLRSRALTQGASVEEGGPGATHWCRAPCTAAWGSLSSKPRLNERRRAQLSTGVEDHLEGGRLHRPLVQQCRARIWHLGCIP